jgi:hypothetical protein
VSCASFPAVHARSKRSFTARLMLQLVLCLKINTGFCADTASMTSSCVSSVRGCQFIRAKNAFYLVIVPVTMMSSSPGAVPFTLK